MSWKRWNGDRLKLNIKKNLRLLREKKGYSQSYVAKLLSVDQSDVSRWENLDEERLPDIDALFLFCSHFDVGIGDLCGIDNISPLSDATFSRLTEYYCQLDVGDRDALVNYAGYLVSLRVDDADEQHRKRGAS